MRPLKDKTLLLEQINPGKWRIVAPKGHVLIDDIMIGNVTDAKLFIEAYISSYSGWTYEIRMKK